MKVSIVEASGKLGRYLLQHALDRGYEVIGVCRERSGRTNERNLLLFLAQKMART